MPLSPSRRYKGTELMPIYFPEDRRCISVPFAANLVLSAGTILAYFTSANASEVQTITPGGTISGGTYRIQIGLATTDPIAYNANAAAIKAAVDAAILNTYGLPAGQITVTGGPLSSGVVTLTWANQSANQPQTLIVVYPSLTGSSPTATVARTTPGVPNGKFAAYDDTLSNGLQVAKGILVHDISTDMAGVLTNGPTPTGGQYGREFAWEVMAIKGIYDTRELIGLDAAGITDLGVLRRGTLAAGLLELY